MKPHYLALPEPARTTSSTAMAPFWSIAFTQHEVVGDFVFELDVIVYMQNPTGDPATIMGAIFAADLDGVAGSAPGAGAVELSIGDGFVQTMTATIPCRFVVRNVLAGGHTLNISWQSTDTRCTVATQPGEASVVWYPAAA